MESVYYRLIIDIFAIVGYHYYDVSVLMQRFYIKFASLQDQFKTSLALASSLNLTAIPRKEFHLNLSCRLKVVHFQTGNTQHL